MKPERRGCARGPAGCHCRSAHEICFYEGGGRLSAEERVGFAKGCSRKHPFVYISSRSFTSQGDILLDRRCLHYYFNKEK